VLDADPTRRVQQEIRLPPQTGMGRTLALAQVVAQELVEADLGSAVRVADQRIPCAVSIPAAQPVQWLADDGHAVKGRVAQRRQQRPDLLEILPVVDVLDLGPRAEGNFGMGQKRLFKRRRPGLGDRKQDKARFDKDQHGYPTAVCRLA